MRLTRALLGRFGKYFDRYIERELNSKYLQRKWHPLTGWRVMKKTDWHYAEHRPWTSEFEQDNQPGKKHKQIYVEPIKEWKVFKGDRVEILVGKDKGKQGIVNTVIKERNWCFVDGLNCDYKLQQMNPDSPPMSIREEKPLLVTTQVKLVDPYDEQPTEVEWRYNEDGDRVRVSKRSGRVIPMPSEAQATLYGVLPSTYTETVKDTRARDVTDVTFKPKLMTFEEDIMEAMGIKEDRKPAKTYWY